MSEENLMPPSGLGSVVYDPHASALNDTSYHQHEYRIANGARIIIRYCIKCGDRTYEETALFWRGMQNE